MLKLRMGLGGFCVELHYGTVRGTLSFFLGCTGKWVKIRPSKPSHNAIRHNAIAVSTATSQWPSERMKKLVIVNPLILALIFRFGVTFQWQEF